MRRLRFSLKMLVASHFLLYYPLPAFKVSGRNNEQSLRYLDWMTTDQRPQTDKGDYLGPRLVNPGSNINVESIPMIDIL